MSGHTKEPWIAHADTISGARGFGVSVTCLPNKANNARRIVACVNTCAGIPTDEIEKNGLPLYMHESLTKQRDELLAALREIVSDGDYTAPEIMTRIAKAAIAKAEAE